MLANKQLSLDFTKNYDRIELPHTHTATAQLALDNSGYHILYYADEDGASGNGIKPLEQRWYGSLEECQKRLEENVFPLHGWCQLNGYDRLDYTDPGYWKDNF